MLLLAVRFLAELAGVAALAYAGAMVPADPWVRLLAAIGAPVALVGTWTVVVAPRARNRLSQRTRQLLGTGLLVLAGAALVAVGQPALGVACIIVVLGDQALILWPGVDARTGSSATGDLPGGIS